LNYGRKGIKMLPNRGNDYNLPKISQNVKFKLRLAIIAFLCYSKFA